VVSVKDTTASEIMKSQNAVEILRPVPSDGKRSGQKDDGTKAKAVRR